MLRHSIRLSLGLFLLAVGTTTCPSAESQQVKPNILFILMDDMGWRDAGCYGSTYFETPNIDRMAGEGMRFTDAYVNAPVCTPSRACIISGQTCPRHDIYIVSPDPSDAKSWDVYRSSIARRPLVPVENNKTLPASVVGLPAALKSASYVTGFTGKGGIRVPLIVRWPGVVKAGSVCHEPVIGTDLYPTCLELTGASLPPNHALDGVSFVPLLRGQSSLDREAIFWHQPLYTFGFDQSPCSVIRASDYKLIEFFEDHHLELYDLSSDLSERVNLAASMPDRARELHEQLQDWRASLSAPLPQPRVGKEPGKPGHAEFKNNDRSDTP